MEKSYQSQWYQSMFEIFGVDLVDHGFHLINLGFAFLLFRNFPESKAAFWMIVKIVISDVTIFFSKTRATFPHLIAIEKTSGNSLLRINIQSGKGTSLTMQSWAFWKMKC